MKFSFLTTKIKTRLRKALVVTATVLTAVAGANFTALPANAALSYDFTSWTFTPCGQTGHLGPTLAMCQTAYAGSTFTNDSNYFYVDSQGQQWWKPPVSGNYRFEVAGAAGGGTNGGRGVVFQEQIALNATYWYCMGIGQKGVADTKSADSGGGGGGTYLGSSSTNTSGNCSNSAGVFAGGGGGGGNTPGKDANPDLSAGGLVIPGLSGSGRGAGVGSAGTDTGKGGPLTGSSSRGGQSGQNTGAYIGGTIVATSTGNAGMGGTAQGGTFGLGLGGDGGFPNGGASCDCVPGGGGGGGGGGYAPGGGGGYDADGTGGGGGGAGSLLSGGLSAIYTGYNLGSINTGNGYLKISYQASTSAVTNLLNLTNTQPYVGGTYTAPTALSFAANDPGATSTWKWQILKNQGSQPGGSPDIVDIPGATATTLVVPASASGYRIRPVQVVTMSNGDLFYFSGAYSYNIAGSHTITGAPADTFKGDSGYTFTFGLSGDYGATATSGWAKASGTLPPGLTIGATTGILSGTPTTAGTYSFVVSHNNGYETATKSISVTIWPSVTFTSSPSQTCVWENACSLQIAATPPAGETITYSISSGTVPTGMTFDPATALFSGTYLANATFYVWVKAVATNGAYSIQKISFGNTIKTQQGFFSAPTFSSPSVTWNAASPPTSSLSWTLGTPNTGLVHIDILTPTICSTPTGFVTSPVTMTALAPGTCTFNMVSDGTATYQSTSSTNRTWTIFGTAQSALTIAQSSGTLNWVDNNTTITVQASGGSGTGAYVYGTPTVATTCVVDPTTGVVTWLTSNPCTVTAYRTKDANYAQSTTYSLAFITPINKAQVTPVTVTSDVSTIQYSAGGKFNVAGSGGDFAPGSAPAYTFYSLTTTVCNPQGTSSQINILNAGTCQIYAKANASGAWTAGTVNGAATSITITGTAQASLSLVANAGNAITYTSNGTINYVVSGGSGTGGWTVANDPSTASICTSSGTSTSNSLTMKGAGTCLINVTKASQGGYYAATEQFSIAIGKASQSVITTTFSPTALTYNPTTPATFTVSGSGGSTTSAFVFSIDSSATSICSINGTTVTALGAGNCIVLGYRSGDANYADSPTLSKTMAISKAVQSPVTITANRTTLTGSDTDPLVVTGAGGSGTGAYVYATTTTTICSIDSATGVVTPKLTGTCSVNATRAADSNFSISTVSSNLSITVTKLAQASFVASSTTTSTTYGAGTFTVSTTGGSGTGSVTYASGNTAICTVGSTTGVTTIVTPGSCVITATKPADTNYLVATSSVTITIAKANQAAFTATLTDAVATVGKVGVYAGGTGGTTGNGFTFAGNDASICVPQGGGMILTYSAGSCVITVTLPGNTYYNDISATITLQVNKGTQATFNLTPSRASGAYLDGASYSVTPTGGSGTGAVSYASNSTSVCSVDSATGVVTILSAGTCSITATKSGGVAYTDATKTATITIAKISQTALVVSADNTAIDYTENPWATAQVSYTGGSSTGSMSYSTSTPSVCSVDATGLVTDITKGKCIVTVTVAADTNYNVATGSVTIRFGKLDQATVTVSSTRSTAVYGAGSAITVSLTGGSGTGSVSFATASAGCSVNASTGVVTYTGAGACVVTATKAADIDYAEASASVTITITKAAQAAVTATLSKTSTTYANGDSITASYTGGSGTGSVSYSTSSSACSVDSVTGAVTVVSGGSCVITVSIAADANYNAASASATLTVGKAAQAAVTASADNSSAVYGDGTSITVSYTGGSSTGAVTFSTSSTACSVNSSTGDVTVLTGGSCVVTVTIAADANYLVASASTTITVNKANQATFNGSRSSNTTYGSATVVTISGSGGSGTGATSYTSTTTGICTVNATTGVIAIVTAGDCVITVTKAADINYQAASDSVTVTIAKANQATVTGSATSTSVTYGTVVANTVALAGGSGTGAKSYSTSSSACSVNATTGVITIITAGSCVVTATKASDTNYNSASTDVTITIAKAAQSTLTATKTADTTYGSVTVITIGTTGGSGTGDVSFASTTSGVCSVDSATGAINIVTAGTCSITATKATDVNYLVATATVSVTIAKAAQSTLNANASSTSMTFNDGTVITVSTTGGSGNGSVTYSSTNTGVCTVNSITGVVALVTAGTCSITATKATDTNYLVATGSTSITIAKASQATVTAAKNADTTYGSTTQIKVTGSGGSGSGTFSYSSTTTGICTIAAGTGIITIVTAGDCVLTATKASDVSYNSATANVTITIAKANQAAATASATYSSVTFGDGSVNTIALSGGTGTGSTSFASNTAGLCSVNSTTGVISVITAGTCSITATKAADTNYNQATASISVTINKASQSALTASSSSSNTTYGSGTVITISTTGGSGTGAVTYSSNTSGVCSVNANTGVITVITAGTCTIAAAKAADVSYNSTSNTVSVVIAKATQAVLVLTPSQVSVTFGSTSSLTSSTSGGSGNGSVSYSSNSTGICTVNASTGEITILSAGTCSITATKAGDTNYNVATDTKNIAIAKVNQSTLSTSGTSNLTHTTAHTTTQITVSGGSGNGSISYSVDATSAGICTVSAGGFVTELHAGTCLINITKASDTNYNAASTTFTATIAKANQSALSISGNQNITYNATTTATSQLTVSGGSSTGSVSYSVNGSSICGVSGQGLITALTGGDCVITITKAGDTDFNEVTASYTITVAKATQAVLIVRTADTLNFNPTTPATTTVSVTSGGSGTGAIVFSTTSSTCSITGSTITALGAGACVIRATEAADSRYLEATADYTIIIGKSLQATLIATPSRTSLKFGDVSNNTATIAVSGGSGSGATSMFVDPSTTGACSVDFTLTPAVVTALTGGSCLVNIVKAGDTNYQESTTSVTFTILKNAQANLDVFSTKTTAIKGETSTLSATGGSTGSNITYSVVTGATVCSISGATLTFIGAGTCTVKATRGGDANFDAVDSAPISLSATKAEQSQLVVAQSAGMLPNVAIGGKASTSWNITGGIGDGAITVKTVSGCYANVNSNVLTATAGTSSGNCTIDIEKAESSDYRATSYRISLTVFDLPTTPSIQTPVLTDTTSADGVQVQIPWTLPNTGNLIAPITGYEVQTKTGSNWQVADGGTVTDPAASSVTISVTPWTSMYVRVAALSDYATTNSRAWSTFGGATAQAFTVPGLVTQLSVVSVPAAAIDSVVVTGVGFNPTLTPTVLLESSKPVFTIAGVAQNSIQVPATVTSPTQLSFRLPGEKLPTGTDSLDISVKVVATNNMQSTADTFQITAGEESVDTGLDPNTGKMTPKINTQYEGTYNWSFTSATKEKIFTSYQCVKSVKVKGKTVCKLYNWVDSTTCSLVQKMPKNTTTKRRVVKFTTSCQLTPAAKNALKSANPPKVVASAKFVKLYPKTHLGWILVKGKKTAILKPSVRILTITLRA